MAQKEMKKSSSIIFALILAIVMLYAIQKIFQDTTNEKPIIYHLQDVYHCSYYVYPNFQDNPHFIKYLFDFANKHSGTFVIVGNKNDVSFEDNVDFINNSSKNSPYFYFSRPDSSALYYDRIRISFISKNLSFLKMRNIAEKRDEKLQKLEAEFETINSNIIQHFLDYTETDTIKSRQKDYTYELYNKYNKLKVQIDYHESGKEFAIGVY